LRIVLTEKKLQMLLDERAEQHVRINDERFGINRTTRRFTRNSYGTELKRR